MSVQASESQINCLGQVTKVLDVLNEASLSSDIRQAVDSARELLKVLASTQHSTVPVNQSAGIVKPFLLICSRACPDAEVTKRALFGLQEALLGNFVPHHTFENIAKTLRSEPLIKDTRVHVELLDVVLSLVHVLHRNAATSSGLSCSESSFADALTTVLLLLGGGMRTGNQNISSTALRATRIILALIMAIAEGHTMERQGELEGRVRSEGTAGQAYTTMREHTSDAVPTATDPDAATTKHHTRSLEAVSAALACMKLVVDDYLPLLLPHCDLVLTTMRGLARLASQEIDTDTSVAAVEMLMRVADGARRFGSSAQNMWHLDTQIPSARYTELVSDVAMQELQQLAKQPLLNGHVMETVLAYHFNRPSSAQARWSPDASPVQAREGAAIHATPPVQKEKQTSPGPVSDLVESSAQAMATKSATSSPTRKTLLSQFDEAEAESEGQGKEPESEEQSKEPGVPLFPEHPQLTCAQAEPPLPPVRPELPHCRIYRRAHPTKLAVDPSTGTLDVQKALKTVRNELGVTYGRLVTTHDRTEPTVLEQGKSYTFDAMGHEPAGCIGRRAVHRPAENAPGQGYAFGITPGMGGGYGGWSRGYRQPNRGALTATATVATIKPSEHCKAEHADLYRALMETLGLPSTPTVSDLAENIATFRRTAVDADVPCPYNTDSTEEEKRAVRTWWVKFLKSQAPNTVDVSGGQRCGNGFLYEADIGLVPGIHTTRFYRIRGNADIAVLHPQCPVLIGNLLITFCIRPWTDLLILHLREEALREGVLQLLGTNIGYHNARPAVIVTGLCWEHFLLYLEPDQPQQNTPFRINIQPVPRLQVRFCRCLQDLVEIAQLIVLEKEWFRFTPCPVPLYNLPVDPSEELSQAEEEDGSDMGSDGGPDS